MGFVVPASGSVYIGRGLWYLLVHVGFNFGITHFNKNIIDGLETVEHGVPRTSEKEMVTEYMVQGERGGTG